MKAIKGNKEYTISEVQVSSYKRDGYDIYDDEGNVVSYGAGKTVPYEKYIELKKENEELKKKLEALTSEPSVENEGTKSSRTKK